MKSIIFIFFIVFVVGCNSHEYIVSVRQVQNDSPVILRIRKDRTAIHSLLYPIAFEFKKNGNRKIYYAENSYYAKNENICPGTAGCYLRVGDNDRSLTYSYRKFDGKIKYVIDKNDTIKEFMSVYYKKMINENKDTIHVSLKEFNNHFKYILNSAT